MTIIYPINGKNERLGELFKTPKHLLLYQGKPAIVRSVEYMRSRFPHAKILLLVNKLYFKAIPKEGLRISIVPDTNSQIETLRHGTENLTGPVMFVDCDIIPVRLNEPQGNTVYLFENKLWMKQYSNYLVAHNRVLKCNEKGEYHPYAGAGIYYFNDVKDFNDNSKEYKSISQVVSVLPFHADTTSNIFRFGTLNDIKNDEQLADTIY
jgi:GTP:adenosylcobinamide-phosphate guanylyltransferase